MLTDRNESQDLDDSEVTKTEIRIALVLYGGVSLAIYENGVSRTFFDLVKRRGVFDLLLKLLDARAVVDAISGASAGGINGLMLAAALESGSDFGQTAATWRNLADIAELLRPISEGDIAESLFKGETYYQEKLIEAFRSLVIRPDDKVKGIPSHLTEGDSAFVPGEIDVFIAGTDLSGHVKTYTDGLGKKLEDKSHRVLFHLEHRPERKRLGMPSGLPEDMFDPNLTVESLETKKDQSILLKKIEEQAVILASIARITSTFPAAFPPFRVRQVPSEHQNAVSQALAKTSQLPTSQYIDGGVLDNKPFEPVLQAVFHRMPFGRVDRRLFYVEPDPEEFSQGSSVFTPLSVITAALTGLPSHQSIGEKLEELRRHNERTKWLRELKKDPDLKISSFDFYDLIRKQSLAKSLVLGEDEVPWAGSVLPVASEYLYDALVAILRKYEPNPYDVDFHIRRAFYFLYRLRERLENLEVKELRVQGPTIRLQIIALGRILKYLKLIRDFLVGLRGKIFDTFKPPFGETKEDVQKSASHILELFRRFLQIQNEPWALAFNNLKKYEDMENQNTLSNFVDPDTGPLRKRVLTDIRNMAKKCIDEFDSAGGKFRSSGTMDNGNVLQHLERITRQIIETSGNNTLDQFVKVDACFYPLEYAAGIHELDEIEFVRISPKDANVGLSNYPPRDKVSGDDFFHFAAFFRKDWRSNDILWGRIDSISTVISALLNFKEEKGKGHNPRKAFIGRVKSSDFDELFNSPPFDGCPTAYLDGLREAWHTLKASDLTQADIDNFARVLIEAAQEAAVAEDLEGVYSDHFDQEMLWDRIDATRKTEKNASASAIQTVLRSLGAAVATAFKGSSSSTTIQTIGEQLAVLAKRRVTAFGQAFKELKLGEQKVFGPESPVPTSIFAEYVTQAYLLLWGMLNRSFKSLRLNVMEDSKVRLFFRHPVGAIYTILVLMRSDETLAALSLMGILTASAVFFLLGLGDGINKNYIYSILLLIVVSILLRLQVTFRRKMFSRIVFSLAFFALLGCLVVATGVKAQSLWLDWAKISKPIFDEFNKPFRQPDFAKRIIHQIGLIASGLSALWVFWGVWRLISQPGFRLIDLELAIVPEEVQAIITESSAEKQQPMVESEYQVPEKPGFFRRLVARFRKPRGVKEGKAKKNIFRRGLDKLRAIGKLKNAIASIWTDLPFVVLYWLLLMSLSILLYERQSFWAFQASIIAAVCATAGAALDLVKDIKLLKILKVEEITDLMVATVRMGARSRFKFLFLSIGLLSLNFLPHDGWILLGYLLLTCSILGLVNFGSRRVLAWGLVLAGIATLVVAVLFTFFPTRFPQ